MESAVYILGQSLRRATPVRGGRIVFKGRHPVPTALALAAEALPVSAPSNVLFVNDDDGILAMASRALWSGAVLTRHHLDAFVARGASANLVANGVLDVAGAVSADLPGGPFDLVVVILEAGGDSLLGRELLEQAHDQLCVGGRLLAATNRKHHWMMKVVKEVFGNAELPRLGERGGAVVSAKRTVAEASRRDHDHAFRVAREGRELSIRTRPGVFSHGRLDLGSKALLASFTAADGERTLDLGCGAGVLGIAAAADLGDRGVVLVDSNARAVALATDNARTNGFPGVEALLRADLEDLPGGPFDLVLANPPYFSNGRIADSFTVRAAEVLSKTGRYLLVAKAIGFHRRILERCFRKVGVETVDDYGVFTCSAPFEEPKRCPPDFSSRRGQGARGRGP